MTFLLSLWTHTLFAGHKRERKAELTLIVSTDNMLYLYFGLSEDSVENVRTSDHVEFLFFGLVHTVCVGVNLSCCCCVSTIEPPVTRVKFLLRPNILNNKLDSDSDGVRVVLTSCEMLDQLSDVTVAQLNSWVGGFTPGSPPDSWLVATGQSIPGAYVHKQLETHVTVVCGCS